MITRPSVNQHQYYSGHKKQYNIKFQSVITLDGLILSLTESYTGNKNNNIMFKESGIPEQITEVNLFINQLINLTNLQQLQINNLFLFNN